MKQLKISNYRTKAMIFIIIGFTFFSCNLPGVSDEEKNSNEPGSAPGTLVPEIGVSLGSVNIELNETISFGVVYAGDSGSEQTFTISNSGTEALSLSSPVLSNGDTGDFLINTSSMSSSITGGNSTTFTVVFSPAAEGHRTAAIIIANNGDDENPFTFTVTGAAPTACSGTITITSSSSWVCNESSLGFTPYGDITANIKLVGGGGSGYNKSDFLTFRASSGGAGQVVNRNNQQLLNNCTYTITVGSGGAISGRTLPRNGGISNITGSFNGSQTTISADYGGCGHRKAGGTGYPAGSTGKSAGFGTLRKTGGNNNSGYGKGGDAVAKAMILGSGYNYPGQAGVVILDISGYELP